MSDYDDDDNDSRDDEPQTPESTRKNDWRRKLEQEAEDGRRAAEEARQAKRELAFLKAGIDLNGELTPQQKLFVKAYDGDVTPDAVLAQAREFGIIDTPAPAVPAEELAAHDRFAQAANGGVVQSAQDQALAAVQNAQSMTELLSALAAADPSLIDTQSKPVPGTWSAGGSEGTPVTRPVA